MSPVSRNERAAANMSISRLEVSYAQLAVFDARLERPFNDWSDAHVRQGFAWRPGSVSFATLETSGPIEATVARSTETSPSAEPERAIVVPFTVPAHGEIEIATISASMPLPLAPGEYALTFRHGHAADGTWAVLTFELVTVPVRAEILVADAALRPGSELVMTATPAS